MDIWSKPLASWTLLDVVGVLTLAPLALLGVWFAVIAVFATVIGLIQGLKTLTWLDWIMIALAAGCGAWALADRLKLT